MLTGLKKMTSTARDEIDAMVNTHPYLVAAGGTNIELGLRSGLNVLRLRRTMNPVTSVLLLTDGQDGYKMIILTVC
jgi:hypothetical protein